MSHRLQHIVLYASSPLEEGSPIPNLLLDEVNMILIQPDLYKPEIFSELNLSKRQKAFVERTGIYATIYFDDEDSPSSIFGFNRILTEDAYAGLILSSEESKKVRVWWTTGKIS